MNLRRIIKAVVAEIGFGKVETVVINESPDYSMLGRTAVISGGTSGIGFAIAERFVKSGCNVVVLGRDEVRGKIVEEKLQKIESPGFAHYLRCDVSAEQEIDVAFHQLAKMKKDCSIDILVNSAGINVTERFPYIDERSFDKVLDVNVRGTLLLSQFVARNMIERGIHGNILNIGSVSGFRPASGPYEISKWAVRGLTIGMADELIKYGIVVNAVAPGPTATAMTGQTDSHNSALELPWNPSGRMADPREIAEIAQWLVSNPGRLIVGDTVCASGGAGVVSLQR